MQLVEMSAHSWTLWQQQVRCPLGNLVEVGEVKHSRGGMPRFRYLKRFALVLITRGEGIYEDEQKRTRSVTAGDWIMVLPELGHSYRPWESGGWDEIYVMFEGPVFDAWHASGLLGTEHVTGRIEEPAEWIAQFMEWLVQAETSPLEKVCAFQTLLAKALESTITLSGGDGSGPSWFSEACRLLSQPRATGPMVAETLGIPYETFRRSFQEHGGQSPHRYHRRQLINTAARMLDTTDLKAAEVARTLGFCDEAYFSRTFKKITGRSPRAYRATSGWTGPGNSQ